MIYLVVFALTTCLLYLSSKCKGLLSFILAGMGLIIPCLFAGFRDETVGTDVLTYAKWMCQDAQNMGLQEYMAAWSNLAASGWNLFTWVAVKVTGGLQGYLFSVEALCLLPVYLGLRKMSKDFAWLGILAWLPLEYSFTFNGMKQAAAMSFVFYGATFLYERRLITYTILVILGSFFHQTALFALLFYPVAHMSSVGSSFRRLFGKWTWVGAIILVFVAILVVYFFGQQMIVVLSMLKDSYSHMVDHMWERDFSFAGLYLSMLGAACWFMAKDKFNINDTEASFTQPEGNARAPMFVSTCLLVMLGGVVWQLNYISDALGRLGYYGTCLLPYTVPFLAQNGKATRPYIIVLLGGLLIYFIISVLMLGKNGVWPYTSMIFGIT